MEIKKKNLGIKLAKSFTKQELAKGKTESEIKKSFTLID